MTYEPQQLLNAICTSDLTVVSHLLKSGIDPSAILSSNDKYPTAFHSAIHSRNLKMIELLCPYITEAALFKAGIAAKQDEKLKISYFQVRGNRLRLVGADNKVAHRYVYDKVAGAVMGIPLVLDPEFDAAFPVLA